MNEMMMVNSDERYGGMEKVEVQDYLDLNPDGEFFSSYDGIYERNSDGPDTRVAVPVLDFEWAPSAAPVTVAEAAEWFGVPAGTLRAALQRHALDGRKSGGIWLVSREDMRMYLRRTHGLD